MEDQARNEKSFYAALKRVSSFDMLPKIEKKKAENNGEIMASGTSYCSKGKRHNKLNSFIVTESDYHFMPGD